MKYPKGNFLLVFSEIFLPKRVLIKADVIYWSQIDSGLPKKGMDRTTCLAKRSAHISGKPPVGFKMSIEKPDNSAKRRNANSVYL